MTTFCSTFFTFIIFCANLKDELEERGCKQGRAPVRHRRLSVMAVSLDQSASGPMFATSSARAPPPRQSLQGSS